MCHINWTYSTNVASTRFLESHGERFSLFTLHVIPRKSKSPRGLYTQPFYRTSTHPTLHFANPAPLILRRNCLRAGSWYDILLQAPTKHARSSPRGTSEENWLASVHFWCIPLSLALMKRFETVPGAVQIIIRLWVMKICGRWFVERNVEWQKIIFGIYNYTIAMQSGFRSSLSVGYKT